MLQYFYPPLHAISGYSATLLSSTVHPEGRVCRHVNQPTSVTLLLLTTVFQSPVIAALDGPAVTNHSLSMKLVDELVANENIKERH